MSDERARRVGLNEALFREVNEEIESVNQTFGGAGELTILCECADGDCTDKVEIAASEYERVRADPLLYMIVPGHDVPDFETVVSTGEGYDVVRKHSGAPAEISKKTYGRS